MFWLLAELQFQYPFPGRTGVRVNTEKAVQHVIPRMGGQMRTTRSPAFGAQGGTAENHVVTEEAALRDKNSLYPFLPSNYHSLSPILLSGKTTRQSFPSWGIP